MNISAVAISTETAKKLYFSKFSSNGSKPIFYCLIFVQMSKIYCKQEAHGSMFLEGKFSNLLSVAVCLKQSHIKYQSVKSVKICGIK